MRNGSLWSDVVFEKGVIFHEFHFETSSLEFEVSKSNIWKHRTLCDKGVFSFIIISQLRRPIELKISQVCYYMHMLRYSKWEDWSLTITNSVHVFKQLHEFGPSPRFYQLPEGCAKIQIARRPAGNAHCCLWLFFTRIKTTCTQSINVC